MVKPEFEAFLKFKKHVAEKLQISNGPLAAKAAGAAQREAKEKHPEMDSISIANEAKKIFDGDMQRCKIINL